mgnify:CR=1 FL=1
MTSVTRLTGRSLISLLILFLMMATALPIFAADADFKNGFQRGPEGHAG